MDQYWNDKVDRIAARLLLVSITLLFYLRVYAPLVDWKLSKFLPEPDYEAATVAAMDLISTPLFLLTSTIVVLLAFAIRPAWILLIPALAAFPAIWTLGKWAHWMVLANLGPALGKFRPFDSLRPVGILAAIYLIWRILKTYVPATFQAVKQHELRLVTREIEKDLRPPLFFAAALLLVVVVYIAFAIDAIFISDQFGDWIRDNWREETAYVDLLKRDESSCEESLNGCGAIWVKNTLSEPAVVWLNHDSVAGLPNWNAIKLVVPARMYSLQVVGREASVQSYVASVDAGGTTPVFYLGLSSKVVSATASRTFPAMESVGWVWYVIPGGLLWISSIITLAGATVAWVFKGPYTMTLTIGLHLHLLRVPVMDAFVAWRDGWEAALIGEQLNFLVICAFTVLFTWARGRTRLRTVFLDFGYVHALSGFTKRILDQESLMKACANDVNPVKRAKRALAYVFPEGGGKQV